MTKIDKLKDAIEKAQKTIEELNIEDSDLRRSSFEKAIDFFLNEDEEQELGELHPPNVVKKQDELERIQFWDNLQKDTNIPVENLKDVYSFDEKKKMIYVIHLDIKGTTEKEKRKNAALLIMFAYTFGLKCEWVAASSLKAAVDELNLYSSKFAQVMTDKEFRSQGTTKYKKYKLSLLGQQTAKEYLEELSNNDRTTDK